MNAFSMSERSEIVRSRTSTMRTGAEPAEASGPVRVDGVLLDLLMAVMDSPSVWSMAAHDTEVGLHWRDATTRRMRDTPPYRPYADLVAEAAAEVGLSDASVGRLWAGCATMPARPDAAALRGLTVPVAFVSNCSQALAKIAAGRSGLDPRFVLSAEAVGRWKPDPAPYLEGCRRLGTTPARTAFVAGAAYDASGAAAAGLRAILVRRRPDAPRRLQGVVVVDDLRAAVAALLQN